MASTRLQRKARRNKARAKKKVATIQRLNSKPVIKNVDVEEIKKEFAQNKTGKKAEKTEPKAEAKKAENPEAKKAEPKAEKAEPKKEKAEASKKEVSTGVDIDALLSSVGKADESSKDDLKAINGVGPAFEKKLNSVGLYTYEQISKLTKKDIENLSKLEGVSADKIEADDWKGTAKGLLEGNKGE